MPGAEHLYQMKAVLYERPTKNPVQQVAYEGFRPIGGGKSPAPSRCRCPARSAFAMTPLLLEDARDARPASPPSGIDDGHRLPVLGV